MLLQKSERNLFDTWRKTIKDQDKERAIQLREALAKDILKYSVDIQCEFLVLNVRTSILERDLPATQLNIIKMEKYLKTAKREFVFFYHVLNGVYNYLNKNYESAMYQYKLAKKYIDNVQDSSEIAEYHYGLGAVYYEANKITLAIQHIHQAFDIYKKNNNFKRMADCHCLLASNHYEIKQFSEAERHYKKALNYGEHINYSTIIKIVHHNLGFLYGEQNKSAAAIKHLEHTLSLPGDFDSEQLIKTHFLLARESFNLGKIDAGNDWYYKGLTLAKKTGNEEYIHHLSILKGMYDPEYTSYSELEEEYIEAIEYFRSKENWYFVEKYSSMIAAYYKDNGDFETACDYYELMAISKEKMDYKGVLNND